MPTIIEMEGFTIRVEGDKAETRVRYKNDPNKETWKTIPINGPVWKRVMAKVAEAKVDQPEADKVIENIDVPATGSEAGPAPETKAARKRRLKAEREAAEAAVEADGSSAKLSA